MGHHRAVAGLGCAVEEHLFVNLFQPIQAAPIDARTPRSAWPRAQQWEDLIPHALLVLALLFDGFRHLPLEASVDLVEVTARVPGTEIEGLRELLAVRQFVLVSGNEAGCPRGEVVALRERGSRVDV